MSKKYYETDQSEPKTTHEVFDNWSRKEWARLSKKIELLGAALLMRDQIYSEPPSKKAAEYLISDLEKLTVEAKWYKTMISTKVKGR